MDRSHHEDELEPVRRKDSIELIKNERGRRDPSISRRMARNEESGRKGTTDGSPAGWI